MRRRHLGSLLACYAFVAVASTLPFLIYAQVSVIRYPGHVPGLLAAVRGSIPALAPGTGVAARTLFVLRSQLHNTWLFLWMFASLDFAALLWLIFEKRRRHDSFGRRETLWMLGLTLALGLAGVFYGAGTNGVLARHIPAIVGLSDILGAAVVLAVPVVLWSRWHVRAPEPAAEPEPVDEDRPFRLLVPTESFSEPATPVFHAIVRESPATVQPSAAAVPASAPEPAVAVSVAAEASDQEADPAMAAVLRAYHAASHDPLPYRQPPPYPSPATTPAPVIAAEPAAAIPAPVEIPAEIPAAAPVDVPVPPVSTVEPAIHEQVQQPPPEPAPLEPAVLADEPLMAEPPASTALSPTAPAAIEPVTDPIEISPEIRSILTFERELADLNMSWQKIAEIRSEVDRWFDLQRQRALQHFEQRRQTTELTTFDASNDYIRQSMDQVDQQWAQIRIALRALQHWLDGPPSTGGGKGS